MLRIVDQLLDPRLVIFDKDGTLLAFERLWHAWFEGLMQALDDIVQLDEVLQGGLAGTLGYDPTEGAWDPLGPLTLASPQEVAILIAGHLYHYGEMPWDRALDTVAAAQRTAQDSVDWHDLIEPIGDVKGTLVRLQISGCRLALATTDDRAATETALETLDIAALFECVVCGDDGIPVKPQPDMAMYICEQLDVAPAETMMVGDSVADLHMARRADLGWAIGVTSGALEEEHLAPYADWVVPDIHAIEVVANLEDERDA